MMTATTTHTELPSIGNTLRSLREGRNISVADVASKMHLDSKIVNAIETDNFASLPDAIYVRGYIRSYSKLVGANADEMVKLFEQHGGNFEPDIVPEIRYSSQTSSSDKPVKAFTYLISLALVVLLIAWWQSNFVIELPATSPQEIAEIRQEQQRQPTFQPTTRPLPAYSANNLQEIPVLPIGAEGVGEGSIGTYDTVNQGLEPGQTAREYDLLPGALPPSNLPASGSQMNSETAGLPDTATTTEAMVTGMTGDSAVPSAMTPLPAQNATTSTQPTAYQTTGPDLIVLKLTADSWIEIIDANNTKVFFDLGRPGDVFNVRGTAPFDVLLGFAQAVTIELNGVPFNAAPYSRAGVARFTLGE